MRDFRSVEFNFGINKVRIYIFLGIVISFFSLVILRIVDMQILSRDKFVKLAMINMAQQLPIPAERGMILDVNRVPLAYSEDTIGVFVIQKYLPQNDTLRLVTLSKLAGVIGKDIKFVLAAIERRKWDIYGPIFISEITKEQAVNIMERSEDFPGVFVDTISLRTVRFPYETAHLIGYLGPISQSEFKLLSDEDKRIYNTSSYLGKDGIERVYDKVLRGIDGVLFRYIDAKNNIVGSEIVSLPIEGKSLRLSIDADIQKLAYELLKPYRGSLVVMKPATGEIVALVSTPSYNPNRLSRGDASYFLELSTDQKFPLFNRAIQGTYQPGSTFKLVTAAAALYYNKWVPERSEYCTGALRIGKRVFNDWAVHGNVKNIIDAIRVSCDVYFYKIGLSLEPNEMIEMAKNFGVGERTFIDLPNEKIGLRISEDLHRKKYRRDILSGDMANMSIGQGDWLLTPLQLAVLGSIIYNEGIAYKPHIVKEILSYDGKEVLEKVKPEVLRKFDLPKEIWKIIKEGMKEVFERGTASGLKYITKYPISCKTGTAENPHGKPHSVFLAFAPTDGVDPNDAIVVAVIIENVGAGSAFAGPVAARVIEAYFNKYGYKK
jgi:penicillin-binding protein 2